MHNLHRKRNCHSLEDNDFSSPLGGVARIQSPACGLAQRLRNEAIRAGAFESKSSTIKRTANSDQKCCAFQFKNLPTEVSSEAVIRDEGIQETVCTMEGEITCNQSTARLKSEGGDRQGKPKSKEISLEEQKAEM